MRLLAFHILEAEPPACESGGEDDQMAQLCREKHIQELLVTLPRLLPALLEVLDQTAIADWRTVFSMDPPLLIHVT